MHASKSTLKIEHFEFHIIISFLTDGCLMQNDSIAETSYVVFCNTIVLHLTATDFDISFIIVRYRVFLQLHISSRWVLGVG